MLIVERAPWANFICQYGPTLYSLSEKCVLQNFGWNIILFRGGE